MPDRIEAARHALCARTQAKAATEYITKLERELTEALRELYTCYAVEGTATQLGRACRRAKALIARIDAEKAK